MELVADWFCKDVLTAFFMMPGSGFFEIEEKDDKPRMRVQSRIAH